MSKYLETKTGSLEEVINAMKYEEPGRYAKIFKRELEKAGKGIGAMSDQEKKDFFNKIDKKYNAKNEAKVDELTKAQEKLPPALQKAIKKKEKMDEEIEEGKMSQIHQMKSDGKSPEEIGKALKISPKLIRQVLGEGTMIGGLMKYAGQSSSEYNKAKMDYKKFMSTAQPAKTAADKVLGFVFDDELLDDIYDASKKNPSKDVRGMVKARLMKLGVKEETTPIEESVAEIWAEAAKKKMNASKVAPDEADTEEDEKGSAQTTMTGKKADKIEKKPEISVTGSACALNTIANNNPDRTAGP